jgi:hypothetical protein
LLFPVISVTIPITRRCMNKSLLNTIHIIIRYANRSIPIRSSSVSECGGRVDLIGQGCCTGQVEFWELSCISKVVRQLPTRQVLYTISPPTTNLQATCPQHAIASRGHPEPLEPPRPSAYPSDPPQAELLQPPTPRSQRHGYDASRKMISEHLQEPMPLPEGD